MVENDKLVDKEKSKIYMKKNIHNILSHPDQPFVSFSRFIKNVEKSETKQNLQNLNINNTRKSFLYFLHFRTCKICGCLSYLLICHFYYETKTGWRQQLCQNKKIETQKNNVSKKIFWMTIEYLLCLYFLLFFLLKRVKCIARGNYDEKMRK